jgi:CubicO group peptidase (beta-lactamase class C family)
VLSADTPETTAAGTPFTAPAGWTIVLDGPRALLTGPEPDLHVAVADTTAVSADDAVASAWRAVHPDFKRPLKVSQPKPGRHGWDEQRDYVYETSPNEKLVVFASALRKGQAWTVVLVESSEASIEKRFATYRRIGETLHPKGYERESFSGKTPRKLDADRIKQILASADKARELSGIPGMGIALLQDGKVIYEGGLGVREVGKPDKVDAHTRFLIGSNSKALTTLLLAKLVDEGKLTWDTPVTSLLPSFKLGDADTTRQVLVKHLICACTGMPRRDFEWIFHLEKQTPARALELLGTMQPTTKFGETFQYSNQMAAAAGYVAGHVAYPKKDLGAAYDEAMQTRVFGPLGMTETTFDFARALHSDHATGHEPDINGTMAVAPMDLDRSAISVRPCGGAWSSVHDMAKYVAMELARGTLPDGKRYVSEDALLARRKPQVATGEFAEYGMGSVGRPRVGHPGGAPRGRLVRFPRRHVLAARRERRRSHPHERLARVDPARVATQGARGPIRGASRGRRGRRHARRAAARGDRGRAPAPDDSARSGCHGEAREALHERRARRGRREGRRRGAHVRLRRLA